jgi:hypothetical protein
MGKTKKSNRDLDDGDTVERSPKRLKESKSASPHGKNQSPKRTTQTENGAKKSKGTPKKPAPKLASVEDLFPGKRVAAHSVSLKNGFSGVLDNVNGAEDDKVETENVELSTSPQQKLKTTKSAEPLVEKSNDSGSQTKSPKKNEPVSPKSKKTNGTPKKPANGTSSTDLSLLFSEHDRLLPGSKRTSMTQTYVSSGPYSPHLPI